MEIYSSIDVSDVLESFLVPDGPAVLAVVLVEVRGVLVFCFLRGFEGVLSDDFLF